MAVRRSRQNGVMLGITLVVSRTAQLGILQSGEAWILNMTNALKANGVCVTELEGGSAEVIEQRACRKNETEWPKKQTPRRVGPARDDDTIRVAFGRCSYSVHTSGQGEADGGREGGRGGGEGRC